jgi:hypothetical protein
MSSAVTILLLFGAAATLFGWLSLIYIAHELLTIGG